MNSETSSEIPSKLEPHFDRRRFKSRPQALRAAQKDLVFAGASFDTLMRRPYLAVEIGCGVGLHPIQYLKDHEACAMIAIERTSEKFSAFAGRLANHSNLHNRLCAVHADAFSFLDENFPNQSIDEAWILYPNPEPKKPTRRWFYTPFTNRLLELLKPGAKIFLATNIESYAHDCAKIANDVGLISERFDIFDKTLRPEWKPRTHFEKKYFERGETLYDMQFVLKPNRKDDK